MKRQKVKEVASAKIQDLIMKPRIYLSLEAELEVWELYGDLWFMQYCEKPWLQHESRLMSLYKKRGPEFWGRVYLSEL